jgi:hypothetical protein
VQKVITGAHRGSVASRESLQKIFIRRVLIESEQPHKILRLLLQPARRTRDEWFDLTLSGKTLDFSKTRSLLPSVNFCNLSPRISGQFQIIILVLANTNGQQVLTSSMTSPSPVVTKRQKRTMLEFIFTMRSPPRGTLARLTFFLRTNFCHTNLNDALDPASIRMRQPPLIQSHWRRSRPSTPVCREISDKL